MALGYFEGAGSKELREGPAPGSVTLIRNVMQGRVSSARPEHVFVIKCTPVGRVVYIYGAFLNANHRLRSSLAESGVGESQQYFQGQLW